MCIKDDQCLQQPREKESYTKHSHLNGNMLLNMIIIFRTEKISKGKVFICRRKKN